MSNICGNDDVDESAGTEDVLDGLEREGAEGWDDDPTEYDYEAADDYYQPEEFDDGDQPYGDEVSIVAPSKRRRYGADVVVGVCSRPISTSVKSFSNGIVIKGAVFHHWRKHLYKRRGVQLVCRRCGEVWTGIPF